MQSSLPQTAKSTLQRGHDISKDLLKKANVHNPLPDSLENDLIKAADVLHHFVHGNNQLDSAMIPKNIIANAKGYVCVISPSHNHSHAHSSSTDHRMLGLAALVRSGSIRLDLAPV